MKWMLRAGLVGTLMLMMGCSSTAKDNEAQAQMNGDQRDPFESVNRDLWDFNWDVLDKHILRPAAIGYHDYVPDMAKTGLLNAANNLDEPFTFFNELLQFKLLDATITGGRFLLNSTAGIFGLIDVATHVGIPHTDEDFGQTLAVWGVNDGAYLMLPAMGPSTVADTSGSIVDSVAFSFNLLNLPETLIKKTIQVLDTRYSLIDQERLLKDSLDPYAFVKETYLLRQEYKDHDGEVPEDNFDYLDNDTVE